MTDIIYEAHSGWRYIVILVAILTIARYLIGWFTDGKWNSLDTRLGTSFPIVMDIQFLLGIVLWIMLRAWSSLAPYQTWEHPVTMIIAVAVAHITWTRVKKTATDRAKFRTGTLGFILSGLLLAVGIARITQVI